MSAVVTWRWFNLLNHSAASLRLISASASIVIRLAYKSSRDAQYSSALDIRHSTVFTLIPNDWAISG
jgi:hypothetical protein